VYHCLPAGADAPELSLHQFIVLDTQYMAYKHWHSNVGKREEKWPPTEEEMLKILARDDKKDDERICTEHSFTDFRASSRS